MERRMMSPAARAPSNYDNHVRSYNKRWEAGHMIFWLQGTPLPSLEPNNGNQKQWDDVSTYI